MKLIEVRVGNTRIILPTWNIRLSAFLRKKLIYRKVELKFEKMQVPEDKFELLKTFVLETKTLSFPFKQSVVLSPQRKSLD